jgi:hypothetical protein
VGKTRPEADRADGNAAYVGIRKKGGFPQDAWKNPTKKRPDFPFPLAVPTILSISGLNPEEHVFSNMDKA